MKLKEIREEHELNQYEVAEILNVSRSVYGMWEHFNVSTDYIVGKIDNKVKLKEEISLLNYTFHNLPLDYNRTIVYNISEGGILWKVFI